MADTSPTLEELKAELGQRVGEQATDFDEILRLASNIAEKQEGVVRFAADAALVRRLGRELVAKQETALGELVKNAYDADATSCTVNLIEDIGERSFEIVDDGSGMTYREITNGFMRLASDEKVVNPISPRFGRSRAGKKGIGRFATERLGATLTIITQTEHEPNSWTVEVDWSAFEQGIEIGGVANRVAKTGKERPHGTRLVIGGLRDRWTDADLRRVYRYLATVIQPVVEGMHPTPESEDEQGRYKSDPGFSVEIERSGIVLNEPKVVANLDTEVLGQALAVITAKVDSAGIATWNMTCPREDITVVGEAIGLARGKVVPLPEARNVELRAHYYIRLSEFLGHSTSAIGNLLDEHGGIRLYRNGYRVPPYGEKQDDWLGLDEKKSTWAPISSKTFFGYVALQDSDGNLFEETSSREGLIESQAFEEVRNLTSKVLETAVRRIEAKRGKGRGSSKKSDPKGGVSAASAIETAVKEVRTAVIASQEQGANPIESKERVDGAVRRLAMAANVVIEIAQERDELLAEVSLLRILASMGLTIAEFTHDFSHLAETMELNLNALETSATGLSEAFHQRMERFRGQFRQVRAYTSHFGSMVTSNASRQLMEIDLYEFARSFEADLSAMFTRRGVTLRVERPREYNLRTTPMHTSEWSSILLNLLTNSMKAVARAQRAGEFLIRMGRTVSGWVYLDFCDNGDGISEENREHIFDAFFTTSGGSGAREPEAVQAVGTGLGLKIVSDIVGGVGGEVTLVEPPKGYSTCFRVAVPGAKDVAASGEEG